MIDERDVKAKDRKIVRIDTIQNAPANYKAKIIADRYNFDLNLQNKIKNVLMHDSSLYEEIDGSIELVYRTMSKFVKSDDEIKAYLRSNYDVLRQPEADLYMKLEVLERYNMEEYAVTTGASLLMPNVRIKEKTLDFLIDTLHYPYFNLDDEGVKTFISNKAHLLGQDDVNLHRNLSVLCYNGLLDDGLAKGRTLLTKKLDPALLFAVTKDLKAENVDVSIENILAYMDELTFESREKLMQIYPFGQTQIGSVYYAFKRKIECLDEKPLVRERKA